MKKFLCATLLAASLGAQAAGQYDGIYMGLGGYYASVHQNGDALVVIHANQDKLALNGYPVYLTSSKSVNLNTVSYWSYSVGTMNADGKTATAVNPMATFGMCEANYTIAFEGSTLTVTAVSANTTAAGTMNGINCSTLGAFPSTVFSGTKLF